MWSYQPEVEAGGAPAFLRIARAVSGDISRGRLKAGDRLPGSRTLARHLGVHRNTAIAAYDELAAQGWVETRPAGGTFVAGDIPDLQRGRWSSLTPGLDRAGASERESMRGIPGAGAPTAADGSRSGPLGAYPDEPWFRPPKPGVLALASGMPDLRLVPVDLVARAYRRAMRLHGRQVLGYGDPQGHESLREALAGMLAARRGLAVGPAEILVTRGSQMALDLIARALLGADSAVAVEALGYRPAWDALRLSGAELLPVPVDSQGMQVDRLEALCEQRRIAAVYVTPHHQYPTTAVMAPSRRLALLELARRRGLTLIEDDYDNEFHFEGRPVLPLAHADRHASVVYVGTLSKILAPGLRLGFVAAARPLIARLTAIRRLCDRQGDLALEAGVAGLIADGELQRHADRMRRTYKQRRDTLCAALAEAFGDRLRFAAPAGGMALWAISEDGTDAEAWARRGPDHGVHFSPGSRFAFCGEPPRAFRIGFAPLDEIELREAVRRMRQARP